MVMNGGPASQFDRPNGMVDGVEGKVRQYRISCVLFTGASFVCDVLSAMEHNTW